GETFDLRAGVTANDNEDGIISDRIVVENIDLSTLNVGKHSVTYSVSDTDNNTVTKMRNIIVEENTKDNEKVNTFEKIDIIGSNRYETASKISKDGWASAKSVIVVNGFDNHLVDGLTATPLASALDAPILLCTNNSLPETTINEIKRLNANNIIVIGGIGAVSESVIRQLENINSNISVNRVSGQNRYETSLNIAKELDKIVPIKKIYIGAGNGEADSLSISSVAGKEKSPIILTAKDTLDNNTYEYLRSKNLNDAYFIGGEAIISHKVIEKVNNITSNNVLENRIAGINRRETNAKVIEKFYPENALNGVIIAKDLDLVDALAVGPLAAKRGFPVVLAEKGLSEGQASILKDKSSYKLYQAGGGVNSAVLESLKKLLAI
ncbi:MAG: cell wall-binding repeat-containing protein, partial [Clostridium sp.]